MNFQVNLFTAIIVLIVGLYDMAYAFNRKRYKQSKGYNAFMILGLIFTISGIILLIMHWVK
ncbi:MULTISPECIES: hypothetical protein [unclassified Lactobacillus]|uniref:hypothetical protein n=1 Tax=unclassified Lactobacillus TaxID=2620435 RepID=UPI000EFA42ED|nr:MULTISPECIES: hypothetical protein [unclassified Lactobacillus]RMC38431.1 hypothetical protein F5ESL0237_05680 [Lactobacillus sp. ESL0237]RMC43239.1 hypothetical protein F5ESL0234_05685 [Lactobacillus sp. ESL0234]RMC44266.1 hypothetical protein F5ESL0236_05690 [Lactobacillus sp. ESL0236]RMC45252.1 hypothetical protein F5ESL0230_06525 [Lactobacillus sp. ESL0230]RMC49234.1 hypothetical protein F5ESL0225_06070 [Lactobacillus sp. ESL0225]